MSVRGTPSRSSARTDLLIWRWQRRAAVLLVPFLLFHVLYQYFVIGSANISFGQVSNKLAVAGFLVLDVALLLLVAAHAFAGVRGVLVDYSRSAARTRAITAAMTVLLVATIAYALLALTAFL